MFNLLLIQGKCTVINFPLYLYIYFHFSAYYGHLHTLIFFLILKIPNKMQLKRGGGVSKKLFQDQTHFFSNFMIHFLLHDIIFLLSGFSTMALNLRHCLPLIIFITGLEFLLYAFSLQFIKVPDITLKCGLIIYPFCIYLTTSRVCFNPLLSHKNFILSHFIEVRRILGVTS